MPVDPSRRKRATKVRSSHTPYSNPIHPTSQEDQVASTSSSTPQQHRVTVNEPGRRPHSSSLPRDVQQHKAHGVTEDVHQDKEEDAQTRDEDVFDASNASNGHSTDEQRVAQNVDVAITADPSTSSLPASSQPTNPPPNHPSQHKESGMAGKTQQEPKKPQRLQTIIANRVSESEQLPRDKNGFVSYFSKRRQERQQEREGASIESRLARIKRLLKERLASKMPQKGCEPFSLPRSSAGSAVPETASQTTSLPQNDGQASSSTAAAAAFQPSASKPSATLESPPATSAPVASSFFPAPAFPTNTSVPQPTPAAPVFVFGAPAPTAGSSTPVAPPAAPTPFTFGASSTTGSASISTPQSAPAAPPTSFTFAYTIPSSVDFSKPASAMPPSIDFRKPRANRAQRSPKKQSKPMRLSAPAPLAQPFTLPPMTTPAARSVQIPLAAPPVAPPLSQMNPPVSTPWQPSLPIAPLPFPQPQSSTNPQTQNAIPRRLRQSLCPIVEPPLYSESAPGWEACVCTSLSENNENEMLRRALLDDVTLNIGLGLEDDDEERRRPLLRNPLPFKVVLLPGSTLEKKYSAAMREDEYMRHRVRVTIDPLKLTNIGDLKTSLRIMPRPMSPGKPLKRKRDPPPNLEDYPYIKRIALDYRPVPSLSPLPSLAQAQPFTGYVPYNPFLSTARPARQFPIRVPAPVYTFPPSPSAPTPLAPALPSTPKSRPTPLVDRTPRTSPRTRLFRRTPTKQRYQQPPARNARAASVESDLSDDLLQIMAEYGLDKEAMLAALAHSDGDDFGSDMDISTDDEFEGNDMLAQEQPQGFIAGLMWRAYDAVVRTVMG